MLADPVPATFLSPPITSGPIPALPPRQDTANGPPLPPRKRQPVKLLSGDGRDRSHTVTSMSSGSVGLNLQRASFTSTANFDLLMSRLDAKEGQAASTASIASGEGIVPLVDGNMKLRDKFEAIKNNLQRVGSATNYEEGDPNDPATIDWAFWTQVVDDYSATARANPVNLSLAIASGVPSELRGVIWQIVSASKSNSLEELYSLIVVETSPHELEIRTDLERISFLKLADSDSLFRIIKGYSLFDPEIGYTQGMAFIAVPLLLNMPEIEAFCLLVKMMKDYGLREFFLTDKPGLHLRLYQFDRILEDTLPDIHIHLSKQGVRSSMYTSPWFLTLFAYKLPLPAILRIYDVIMTEGIEALLKFAIGLMRRNAANILALDFEDLLIFLKEQVFEFYRLGPDELAIEGDESNEDIDLDSQYRVDDFVADAYDVKILPLTLQKYNNEYAELHRAERERVEELEELSNTNGMLTSRIHRLEASVASLTSEHTVVAHELAQERSKAGLLLDENEDLRVTKDVLENEVHTKLADLGENAAEEVSIEVRALLLPRLTQVM